MTLHSRASYLAQQLSGSGIQYRYLYAAAKSQLAKKQPTRDRIVIAEAVALRELTEAAVRAHEG